MTGYQVIQQESLVVLHLAVMLLIGATLLGFFAVMLISNTFVIDGTMRNTPESIRQGSAVFATVYSYTHPMGRLRIKSDNEPIVCAGVKVCPGDIIVADDDGVIVVPQGIADEVAYRAYKIQQVDRVNRRANYQECGKEFDNTVELLPDIER